MLLALLLSGDHSILPWNYANLNKAFMCTFIDKTYNIHVASGAGQTITHRNAH